MNIAPSPSNAEPTSQPVDSADNTRDEDAKATVQPLTLSEFELSNEGRPLEPTVAAVSVDVLFGKARVKQDGLCFAPGQRIVLEEAVDATAELAVGGQCLARGELVTRDGCVGIRVTEILWARENA